MKTKFWNVAIRQKLDSTVNSLILNGRTEGDPFIHLIFNGPSTTNYALCNENFHFIISNFLVLSSTELSDYSKLVTVFKERLERNNPKIQKMKLVTFGQVV